MGDLKNSVERLRKLIKATRYPHAHTTSDFMVADLLRILHHAFLDYSRHVAAFVLEKGYDLYGKTDARFIDQCFRLMREEFQYFPPLNTTQFLSENFVERKLQVVADILEMVVKKHDTCIRRRRQEQAVWSKPREPNSNSAHVQNHVLPQFSPSITEELDTLSLLRHFRRESKQRAAIHRSHDHALGEAATPNDRRFDHESVVGGDSQINQCEGDTDGDQRNSNLDETSQHNQFSQVASETPSRCRCGCHEQNDRAQQALVALSKQIGDLTSSVVARIASIESRLSSIEQQVQELDASRNSKDARQTSPTVHAGVEPAPDRKTVSWPPDPDAWR